MSPNTSIARTVSGLNELAIDGRFRHPHWVAFLTSALAEQQISVVSGRAVSASGSQWEATFLLDFQRSLVSPERIDYAALAETERRLSSQPPPSLSGFFITRRRDGALSLRLVGPDQIGFLGRMLAKLSMLMLFPTELVVDTVDGRIDDLVVLRGTAGAAPPEGLRGSLESMLTGLSRAA